MYRPRDNYSQLVSMKLKTMCLQVSTKTDGGVSFHTAWWSSQWEKAHSKVLVGWRRENIGWTFIQLQYRFFFKKCFYKYLFLSSFKFIVCTRTREDSCLIFEAVLCSCRLCLQTIFNLFSKESGSATKKKKERKNNLFWSDGVSVWARTPGGPVSLLITTKWGDEVRAWKKFKIHPPKHPGPSLPQCGSLILSKRGRERFRRFNK